MIICIVDFREGVREGTHYNSETGKADPQITCDGGSCQHIKCDGDVFDRLMEMAEAGHAESTPDSNFDQLHELLVKTLVSQ